MAIPIGYRANFDTMIQAACDGQICLAECLEKKTGKNVYAVCAVNRHDDGTFELVPMAKLFDCNPYDELVPPTHPDDSSEPLDLN
jgi:hypothetical protein